MAELFAYRELFLILSWRDLRVRYAQTLLGLLWALVQPIFTLSVLYIVFGRFVNIETGNTPQIVFIASGLAPWMFFSYVMSNAGSSILSAQAMVKKIYFPRIIIPLSKAFTGLIDLLIVLALLGTLMVYFDMKVNQNIFFLPLFILIDVLAALGIGIWLSSLTIRFRDVQYVIPFLVQLGLYITPVAYPSEFALNRLPGWAAALYYLNPIAGVVDGFRWALLGTPPPGDLAWISFVSVGVIFVSSLYYFNRIDGKIADLI
jgi:lipopolysaccharide transport system permease protein